MAASAFTRSSSLAPNVRLGAGRGLAGLGAALALSLAAPALAQAPEAAISTAPPPPAAADPAAGPAAPPPSPVSAGPALQPVEAQPLAPPDLFSVGADAEGLTGELWAGASPALMRQVIPQLATQPVSPATAALARRLLSAGANGPAGAGEDAELAGARLMALLRLGDAAAVQAIADRTPLLAQRPALSRAAAEAALILGEDDKACAIGDGLANGRDGVYWLRLRAYCQARAGQGAAAQLTFMLAEQQAHGADYARLMQAFMAGKPDGAPALDNGLDFALSRKAAEDWTSGLAKAAPAIAVAVARDPAAPAPARLEAAARAARLGLPVKDAYAAAAPPPSPPPPPPAAGADAGAGDAPAAAAAPPVPPSPSEIAAAADTPGPAGEAALVALADTASDWTVRQAAVTALLKRARSGAELAALARLVAPDMGQLAAANAVLQDPRLFAAAAAAAGDAASARAARTQAGQAPGAGHAIDLALLDALIAAASGQPAPAELMQALSAAHADAAAAILSGLGAPLGPEARFGIAGAGLGPTHLPPGRLIALQAASAARRIGDTALYALMAASESGPSGPAPGDRAVLVRALDFGPLKADARAFAVEGLLDLIVAPPE